MASLQIDLFDKTNKHRIWVMLRDNLPIEDLIHKLIRDLELPQGEYILIDEEENVTLPEESTLAKEGVRDQHPLRIESKKKIVSFSIPIPIKKGGETYQAGDVRARKARPEEEPPAEKAPARDTACRPKAPTPDEETTALEEKPAPGKKARPAPARTPPPTRPLVPSWRRPIRRPPFLRRVSNQFWALVTPLNIILILIVLFLFCFPGRIICNIPLLSTFCDKSDGTAIKSVETPKETSHAISPQATVIKWNLLEEFCDNRTFYDHQWATNFLYLGLTRFDPETLEVVPGLAESWEVNEAGDVWTFYIQEDVYWVGTNQEGKQEKIRPVNADEILLAFERELVRDIEGGPTWMFSEIVENWGKDDDFTIWFELNEPMDDFPKYASSINGRPISGLVDDYWICEDTPIGNGPFMMAEPWDQGNEIALERNLYFTDDIEGLPDQILFTSENQDTALQKLENGELDVVEITHPIEHNETFADLVTANGRFFLVDNDKKDEVVAAAGFAGLLFNVRPAQSWRLSYTDDNPISCDNSPFTYEDPPPHENSSVIHAFNHGEYNEDSKESIPNPSFGDIRNAVESGKIVVLSREFCYGEAWVELIGSSVITALNRVPNSDGSYNMCLYSTRTGESQLVTMWDMEEWYTPDSSSTQIRIDIYEPNSSHCYWATSYIGFDVEKIPLEMRKALALGFSKAKFLDETFGTIEGWGYGFVPSAYLSRYPEITGEDMFERGLYEQLWEAREWLQDSPDIHNFDVPVEYCDECSGSSGMARNIARIWEENLDIQFDTTPLSDDDYQAPLKDAGNGIRLLALTGASEFDFLLDAVESGSVMVPEEEYENYMVMVQAAALEVDKGKRAELILELEKLLNREYVSLIPINHFEFCE